MCKHLLRPALLFFFLISCVCLSAQQVMMQGWYWDYPKTPDGKSWADTLRLKAASLKQSGITHIWFPPHAVASFGPSSNGYDPKDLFIGNQTTGLGTRPALNNMLSEFTAQGIAPVADVIFNHRDGGAPEVNPAVKNYITNFYTAAKEPFPSDRFRCALPLGGSTGNGAGDYYFKISSKTGNVRFNNFTYKIYAQTNRVGNQGLAALTESEPNGGGDCGQPNNTVPLGRDMNATVETTTGCNTDEFRITLTSTDFFAAGDTLFIFLNNTGGYSDHRIYGIYSASRAQDIVGELLYQTYTDYSSLPSGRGQMNFEFFKPNSLTASTTFLNGDWDGMFFFYDYDQFQKRTKDSLINYAKWNWTDLGVRAYRMDAVKHFTPEFVGDLLDSLHQSGMDPSLVVGEWYGSNTSELSGWLNNVKSYMNAGTLAAIQPKIFDFALRENLRQACDNNSFDVRNVFTGSLRDAAGVSGFNIVTFLNNHDFRDPSGFASLVRNNPDLGYAYLLTNNQLGVPTIFYPDYYGYPAPSGGLYSYHPTGMPAYKAPIDRLIQVLKFYINGSPSVDYLNRFGTPYTSNFIQGSSDKALIYQLQGYAGNGNREVIVAINFGNTTLRVDHAINTRGGTIAPGTNFTDVLGNSAFPFQVLNGSNQVYIELPPRSYSVWVQGSLTVLPLTWLNFSAVPERNNVQLTWEISDNQELRSFSVQRADDGVHFNTIATIPAAPGAGNRVYQHTDKQTKLNQAMLYRIEAEKLDRQKTLSDIRLVRLDRDDLVLRIEGNPVKEFIRLNVQYHSSAPAVIRILNMAGATIQEQTVQLRPGEQRITIPAGQLATGQYQLVITAGSIQRVASFIR
ncbi:MAG: alpha amylase [Bacteroidetes bacterium]|nr:alpha amylase [Bacteroidota bacterium]